MQSMSLHKAERPLVAQEVVVGHRSHGPEEAERGQFELQLCRRGTVLSVAEGVDPPMLLPVVAQELVAWVLVWKAVLRELLMVLPVALVALASLGLAREAVPGGVQMVVPVVLELASLGLAWEAVSG